MSQMIYEALRDNITFELWSNQDLQRLATQIAEHIADKESQWEDAE